MTASRRWTWTLWVAALLLVAWRSHQVVLSVGSGKCVALCGLMAQLHAIRLGLPAWDPTALVGLDPTCPAAGYATYQPAFLYTLAPWVTATGAQACAVWPWVQECAWLVACVAAAWTFRAAGVRYLIALAIILRTMGDPLASTLQTGNLTTVEAAVLWLALAAASHGAWGSNAALSFVLGVAKPVYWIWLALVVAARRWRWAIAAAVACAGWLLLGIGWGGDDAWHIWSNARSHDERGVIHPAFRAWVLDTLHVAPAGRPQDIEVAWMIPATVMMLTTMVWIARRQRVDADAIGLFALVQFSVTPYLKDYGVLVALPVVAWAIVRVRGWMGALLLAAIVAPVLGGPAVGGAYHVLACLWLCALAVAIELRGDALHAAASDEARSPAASAMTAR